MRKLLFFLLLMSPLNCLQLKSRITSARAGDFIVYAHKSYCTLVRVSRIDDKELVIEEISVPFTLRPSNFQEWLEKKAPGNTSWSKNVIDLNTFKVKRRDYNPQELEFLPTLMKLELTPLVDRKKIGPEPGIGEVDHRKIWNPKIVVNSKEVQTKVQAYRIQWPDDGTELSGRLVDIYIPEDEGLTYLPYWIEVYSGPLKLKIFAIDSYRQQL